MATQSERSERTRATIVQAATDLLVERGFRDTTISDVHTAADVSRGALYHHFSSKVEVFEAVYSSVSSDAIRRAQVRAKQASSPLASFIAACQAWIDIATERPVAAILFVEGPKALGWDRCRDLEDAASLGVMRSGLRRAAAAGEIGTADVDLMARLLNAAIAEAALAVHAGRRGASRTAAKRTITDLISGISA